jgi:hypothetical protein
VEVFETLESATGELVWMNKCEWDGYLSDPCPSSIFSKPSSGTHKEGEEKEGPGLHGEAQ